MAGEDYRYGSRVTNQSRNPTHFSAVSTGLSDPGFCNELDACFEPGHR